MEHHDANELNDGDPWEPQPNDEIDLDADEEDEDDSEDDDEEEEADDEAPAVPDALNLLNFTMFDGGIADDESEKDGVEPKPRRKATDADIVSSNFGLTCLRQAHIPFPQTLYFVCSEGIVADHPVLKGGTVVQIGMKKQSFLNVVFRRYFAFCKEKKSPLLLSTDDLEFVHTSILNGEDNAEGAALMKNDRIAVRREQEDDRCLSAKTARELRESERTYFAQMNSMMKTADFQDTGDIVLSCQGPKGLVSCHSFMIRNRCPWLWGLVEDARKQQSGRQSVITLPTEDDILDASAYRPVKVEESSSAAAHIESDDDEDMAGSSNESRPTKLWVHVPYSAEAVRLLLEYIYTNRVVPLGLEAFSKSCKKQCFFKKNDGPIPPFTLRHTKWPNSGTPTIMFQDTLDTVTLAHIAGFPRLALMSEIAASHLVTFDNVVDGLVACETVERLYGAPMVHLRKIAMRLVIQTDYDLDGGVGDFLRHAMREQGALLVPTLLAGTNELIEASKEEQRSKNCSQSPISVSARSLTPRGKRDWRSAVYCNIDKFDKADAQERSRERKKRRKTKHDDSTEDDSWTVRPTQSLTSNRLEKIWQHAKGRGIRQAARKAIARKTIEACLPRRGGP